MIIYLLVLGCHAISLKSVFSCNFESDKCGFTSSHKWSLSKGSAEKELEPDGYMQPPYGYRKGSQFIYSVVKDLPGGSYGKSVVQLYFLLSPLGPLYMQNRIHMFFSIISI